MKREMTRSNTSFQRRMPGKSIMKVTNSGSLPGLSVPDLSKEELENNRRKVNVSIRIKTN